MMILYGFDPILLWRGLIQAWQSASRLNRIQKRRNTFQVFSARLKVSPFCQIHWRLEISFLVNVNLFKIKERIGWNVFHAVPLKTTERYGNARVRSVIIWHSISIFQCRLPWDGFGVMRKRTEATRSSPFLCVVDALKTLRYFFTADGQMKGRDGEGKRRVQWNKNWSGNATDTIF